MNGSSHRHKGILLRTLRKRRRVLEMWVWALLVVLPIQGVALVAGQVSRPAHYHRHLAVSTHPTSALSVPARDDVVLGSLDGLVREDIELQANSGAAPGASPSDHGSAIGYHRHALDDPDVVYLDDPGQSPGDIAKHAPDALMLTQVAWAPLLWNPPSVATWPDAIPAYASRDTHPPERPPRA